MPHQNRQLAAILFTDIVGYTAMMQQDEQLAVDVTRHYITVLKESVASHHGKILNDYGDGSLCSFSSATEAMRCAIEMQQQLQKEPRVPLRIGLHVGELFFEGDKVMGDGVNVASRIQSLGIANSILFSAEINNKLKNQSEFKSVSIGRFHFKNVDESMEVFALNKDGFVVPDKKKIEGKLQEKKTNQKKIIFTVSLLLLAIASFFLYRQYFNKAVFTGKEKSIAVLPFETISSEKENEYITDGFTTDIIGKLSKLSGLSTVPGWARVKGFKNTVKTLKEIADELGVTAILTGTFQRLADKLHITASLYDVNTGKTLWNTDDDRKWEDILTIQGEVAKKIVSLLSAQLTPEEESGIKKQYTENAEAYNYYIKGRYFWDNRTKISFDSAEVNYKKAITLDPNYGLAYAGLADLYIFNNKGLSQMQAVPIAGDYANKALSLDSTLVEATTTIGFIQSAFDYDWKKAKITLERAIQLNPNYAYAHIFYGNLLQYTGENTEKGIDEIKKALDLEPLSASINWILGRNYYFAGKYDLAEKQYRKIMVLNPNFPLTKPFLAYALLAQKKYGEAIELINQIPKNGPSRTDLYQGPILSYAYAVSGDLSRAKTELDKIIKDNPYTQHTFMSHPYIGLKDYDHALSELEKANADKELYMYFLKVEPIYGLLKNEPRFKVLMKKMNLD